MVVDDNKRNVTVASYFGEVNAFTNTTINQSQILKKELIAKAQFLSSTPTYDNIIALLSM